MFVVESNRVQSVRRVSLAKIDGIVSARLGATRVSGNAQPAVFNRQIAMYLAKHVGWSTTAIGRFYNGRDHSTVGYALKRVGALREDDPEVDGLGASLEAEVKTAVAELTAQTGTRTQTAAAAKQLRLDEAFIDALADSSSVTHILDCLASSPQSALAKNADLALIVHDSEHNPFDPRIAAIVATREAGYAYHGAGECRRHPLTPAGVSRSEASINAPRRPAIGFAQPTKARSRSIVLFEPPLTIRIRPICRRRDQT